MKKKNFIGIAVALLVIATLYEVYLRPKSQPPIGNGRFTVTLEPQEITMKIGERRNITVTFTSTGYEGDVYIHSRNLQFDDPTMQHVVDLHFNEIWSSGRFIKDFGKLNMTFSISCVASESLENNVNIDLWLTTCGNYQKEDEFRVSSEPPMLMMVTP